MQVVPHERHRRLVGRFTFTVANGAATGLTFEQSGSTFTGLRQR